MEASFSAHLTELTNRFKSELLQHYERDLASWKANVEAGSAESDLEPSAGKTLRLAALSKDAAVANTRALLKKAPVAESSEELLPWARESGELSTPKKKAELPAPKPAEPDPCTPSVAPEVLLPRVPSSDSENQKLQLPHTLEEPEAHFEVGALSKRSSTTSSSSSASLGSSEDDTPKLPANYLQTKRPSTGSIGAVLLREPAVSRVFMFLQDSDSSNAAWFYATGMNYCVALSIAFTIWQAGDQPVVSLHTEGLIQIVVESILLVELLVHWLSSSEKRAFWKSSYNLVDLLAVLPLVVRSIFGVAPPTRLENAVAHFTLYCFVPVVRQLKLIRKFQKLRLLMHVTSTTLDALKLLLFLASRNQSGLMATSHRWFPGSRKAELNSPGSVGMLEIIWTPN